MPEAFNLVVRGERKMNERAMREQVRSRLRRGGPWTWLLYLTPLAVLAMDSPARAAEGENFKREVVGFGGLQRVPWTYAVFGGTKGFVGGAIGNTVGRNSLLFFET